MKYHSTVILTDGDGGWILKFHFIDTGSTSVTVLLQQGFVLRFHFIDTGSTSVKILLQRGFVSLTVTEVD